MWTKYQNKIIFGELKILGDFNVIYELHLILKLILFWCLDHTHLFLGVCNQISAWDVTLSRCLKDLVVPRIKSRSPACKKMHSNPLSYLLGPGFLAVVLNCLEGILIHF